jgi:hypothetical protein
MSRQPEMDRTTINIPVDLKKQAQKLAIDRDVTLTDLLVEGLRLVLAKKGATR